MQNTHSLNDIGRVESDVLHAWASIVIYVFLREGKIFIKPSHLKASLFVPSVTLQTTEGLRCPPGFVISFSLALVHLWASW